jgi:polyisoprenoid-binding protein YceI
MKKLLFIAALAMTTIAVQAQDKTTNKGFISFYSEMENITANNEDVTSKLNTETGTMVFSVPIQSFIFESSLMQKHFNDPGVMDSKNFPKAKFKGGVTDMSNVDLTTDGTYEVTVKGDLTMKDQTHSITEPGTIVVKGGKITANSTFDLDRFKWGIDGKKKGASQVLKLTVKMVYE